MTKLDIKNLDLAQKIGQLIMPRIDFKVPETIDRAIRLVEEFEVSGFIIFNGTSDIVAKTTHELQRNSNIPLLFGCDAERGLGQIVSDQTLFPFTMSLGAASDEELVYKQASFISQELRDCGLNLIFAPVADVNSNPDNPIINIRSYGDNPELVSNLCSSFIKGAQENGVLACAKHFPGHGRTGVDSHIDLPVLNSSLESLQNIDLIPFEKSIEAGVATIMTAHIAFSQIGGGNAVTISKELVSDVLRENMGFQGLVITDSLHMEGIIKLGDELYLTQKALDAGCDIVLDPQDPINLLHNLRNLEMDLDLLNPKVERILSTKEKFLNQSNYSKPYVKELGTELKNEIAKESVCLVKGSPLKSQEAYIYIFDLTQSGNDISKTFTQTLEDNGISCESKLITISGENNELLDKIPEGAAITCLVYSTIGAWKKQSSLPKKFSEDLSKIESLSNETVLLSFGSPYIIKGFDKFQTIICGFDILDECQSAAAEVLLDLLKPKGSLPVRIDAI